MTPHRFLPAMLALGSAHAAVLVQHNFGGSAADPLDGVSPDVNLLGSADWVADPIITADGRVSDGSNTDRGAYLDLGNAFAFQANQTYTLTMAWTDLDNAILFAGFADVTPNELAQMQTQGTNFALRARRIAAGTDTLGAWSWPSGAAFTGGPTATPGTGTTTLTLETRSLNDASYSVDGASRSVDLTATSYRYLWIGYEDPTSGTSDARFTQVVFEGVPEPSAVVLGSLGLLALLRRRR